MTPVQNRGWYKINHELAIYASMVVIIWFEWYLAVSCEINNGGCHEFADCSMKDGEVMCSCILGYVGDGVVCINKCDDAYGTCSPEAHCTINNKAGPYIHYCYSQM